MQKHEIGRLVLWFVGLAMFSFFWGWVVIQVDGSMLAYMAAPLVYLIFTFGWFSRWFLQVPKYLVWSNEHGAWWGPNYTGYTLNRDEAGRYSRNKALQIVYRANKYRKVDEFPFETLVQE